MSLGTLNPRASEGPCEVPAQISGKEGDHGRPGCGDTLRSQGQIIHTLSTSPHQTLEHMPGIHRLHTGRHRYTYRRADRLTDRHTQAGWPRRRAPASQGHSHRNPQEGDILPEADTRQVTALSKWISQTSDLMLTHSSEMSTLGHVFTGSHWMSHQNHVV